VNSDKQTLILAGESIPRRQPAGSEPRLTIVATRADTTMLLAQGDTAQEPVGESTSSLMMLAPADNDTKLARSFSAADAYARTQDLSGNGKRTAIIDTYA
jgi:hypothetical protein